MAYGRWQYPSSYLRATQDEDDFQTDNIWFQIKTSIDMGEGRDLEDDEHKWPQNAVKDGADGFQWDEHQEPCKTAEETPQINKWGKEIQK